MLKLLRKSQNHRNTSSLGAHHQHKMSLLMVILIGVLCINFVNASLLDNIYAYYSFDESSGITADDSSNNNYDLTLGNITGWIPGIVNNSYFGNGTEATNTTIIENLHVDNNLTINMWIRRTGDWNNTGRFIAKRDATINGDYSILRQIHTNKIQFSAKGSGGQVNIFSDTSLVVNTWYMFTFIINTTHSSIYVNGVRETTGAVAGFEANSYSPYFLNDNGGLATSFSKNTTMDELGFWSKVLSEAEIIQLYNSGNGFNPFTFFPTLNSPSDNTVSAFRTNTFNCSSRELSNVTLYLDGIADITINETFSFQESVSLNVGSHNWTCRMKNINGTFFASNFTINITEFVTNLNSFTSPVLEGTTNTFILNISYNSTRFTNVLGILYHNNTPIASTSKLNIDNEAIFTAIVASPQLSKNTNISFHWEVRLINNTINFFNTTSLLQDTRDVSIDDCGSNSFVLYNFSLRDERTQVILNGTEFNSTIEVNIDIFAVGETTPLIEFNQNYTHNENPRVCFETDLGSTQYQVDAIIRYQADLYSAEFYHIQNSTIVNDSLNQNIDLFDLLSSENTDFLITYKGSNFLPVDDALITIQRKYIEEGVFKTVEIPKTDANGQAVAHLDTNTIKYTIIISKNGVILSTFDNVAAVCDDSVIGDCTISLNALVSTIKNEDWDTLNDISYIMSFDRLTKTVTAIFSTTDGSVKKVSLNTTKYDMFGNVTVCSDILTSSSGTLTCVVPDSFGNITIVSSLFVNSDLTLIARRIFNILPSFEDRGGVENYAMFLILMLTLPMMLISSTMGIVFGIMLGFIMGALLMLYDEPSIMSTTSVIMWVIIAGGIIIWKIQNKGDSV